jgi:hypothetical protein
LSEHLTFFVGNRNPSISETISSGGSAVDLSSSTVKFQARQVGATALLVDAAVSNSPDATGFVRYDWSANDILTGGILYQPRQALCWWRVTTGGKTQDMSEALIEIREHSNTQRYVELDQLKSTLELTGQTFADLDLLGCIDSASRDIDEACGRPFYQSAGSAIRYYTPESERLLLTDDILTLNEIAVDRAGDGTFEETWVENTDFVLEPLNASGDSRPWENLRVRNGAAQRLPAGIERSVRVTATFGWSSVPAPIQTATRILASRLFKRSREAPFGIVTVGSDVGAAMRLSRTDPDVASLIAPYVRHSPFL